MSVNCKIANCVANQHAAEQDVQVAHIALHNMGDMSVALALRVANTNDAHKHLAEQVNMSMAEHLEA